MFRKKHTPKTARPCSKRVLREAYSMNRLIDKTDAAIAKAHAAHPTDFPNRTS